MSSKRTLLCCVLSAAPVAGSFMGIEKFKPEERSLNIGIIADEVSVDAAARPQDEATGLKTEAKSAVLMDFSTGTVLYASNE